MNPMIRKEVRQRMREKKGWILPSLYLLALSAVVLMAYYVVAFSTGREVQGSEIGVALFFTAAYTQLGLLLLLVPIFSAGALTIEKEQRTLAGLLTSLLRPVQIWWGKFVASLLFVLLLLVAGLPVLSTAFAFGGIGPLGSVHGDHHNIVDSGDHQRQRAVLVIGVPAQRSRDGSHICHRGGGHGGNLRCLLRCHLAAEDQWLERHA